MKKRKKRRVSRKKKPQRHSGSRVTPRGRTQFDEHLRLARRIAKKLGKKVAKLAGRSRKKKR